MRKRSGIALGLAFSLFLPLAAKPQSKSAEERWQNVEVATTASFRGLSAVDDEIVWASGTNGTIIRTTNGGSNWSIHIVSGAEKLDFRGIHAFDSNSAVIISSGNAEEGQARIFRTTDGGEKWRLVFEQKTRGIFFDAIAFWDRSHGIVISDPVDGHFALFFTDDGGESWKQLPPEATPRALPNEGAFAASNSCLAVEGTSSAWFVTGGANVARVFRSTDRGKSWSVAETPIHPKNASTGLFSLAFRDSRNGIAVGGDYAKPTESPEPTILITSDAGASWQPSSAPTMPGLFLSAVAYSPPQAGKASLDSVAFAAGTGGVVSQMPRGGWRPENHQNVNAIAFTYYGGGWAVGPKGTVMRYTRLVLVPDCG